MSEINDQNSDSGSEINWPIDHPIERQQHDRVVFENVADQYVKGEDVTAFFTIVPDVKINPAEDRIGLLRVGCTNIKECLAYASVQFNPSTTSGSTQHGTATFSSSSLPVTDDEFYQFCYITNNTKNLGSSIPFQLNCALDDIDLLSNTPVARTKGDGLIALADHDNDDIVVIHTKRMLTEEKLRQENQHLKDKNRRLETQKDECQTKLDLLEIKTNEHIQKVNNDLQTLTASHKTAIAELLSRQQSDSNLRTEYDACRSLCNQYQSESAENAERCRTLEMTNAKILNETNQLRSHLSATSQLTKDQATQIIDLERRLMQSGDLLKTSNERQTLLEQQLRDMRLVSEKYQLSSQGQLESYSKQIVQQTDQINTLQMENNRLKEELNSIKDHNQDLLLMSKLEKDLSEELQQQLDQLHEQYSEKNELAQIQIESLKNELNEMSSSQQAYMALKASFKEIEKRFVKHQKGELEAKRQLSAYKDFIKDLEREKLELTERLSDGAEEYKALSRKYAALASKMGINNKEEQPATTTTTILTNTAPINDNELESLLRDVYENEPEKTITSTRTSIADVDNEVRQCPMCYWEFPQQMTVDGKREHIEHHFA